MNADELRALNLIDGGCDARSLTVRGHDLLNRNIAALLRAGLVAYGSGRRAYRLTAAGRKARDARNHPKEHDTTMTSQYSTFINHNTDLIARRRVERHALGEGMAWGREDHTPREAAEDMGAIVLAEYTDGMILCETGDRLYMVADVDGPWAVEVATQEDLAE